VSKLTDLDSLAAAVPDGATIAIGGFQLSRVPVALLRAVAQRGTRNLSTISAPNPFALDLLAAAGALRAADCGFIGFQYEDGFVTAPALRRGLANGTVALQQRDVFDTIEDLRSAARTGRPLADLALVHAQRADAAGNLEIDDAYVDVALARGSTAVLATAETLVEHIDHPTIAGDTVAAVAIQPDGAAPTACWGHYPRDADGIRQHLGADAPAPPQESAHHEADAFVVDMARQVRDGEVIVTGLASAAAMLAIGLAQRTHAPSARYINCIGAVNPRLERGWPTSVEPELLHDCEDTLDLPDLFDLARDGGVDAMFFGAAQIDARGNINLSRIGPGESPEVRFPGPAGSPSMRSWVRRVLVGVPRQSARNLVQQVDTVTSAPAPRNEETLLITDLAVWRLGASGFAPRSLTAGIDPQDLSSATGFSFDNPTPGYTAPPTPVELAALQHIDRGGWRYGLLPARPSSRTNNVEKVLHDR